MWRDYYDKRYVRLFWDLYASSRAEFRFSPLDSFRIALAAAHAARLFQPTTSREEAGVALPPLEVYYSLLRKGAPVGVRSRQGGATRTRLVAGAAGEGCRDGLRQDDRRHGVDDLRRRRIRRSTSPARCARQAMAYRDARNDKMTDADWRAISGQLATAYGKLKDGIAQAAGLSRAVTAGSRSRPATSTTVPYQAHCVCRTMKLCAG